VTLESSHDYSRMTDPQVLAVRERLTLVPSAEMTRTPPPRRARIEITTTDGRNLSHDSGAVRGTPDNPMTRAEVEDKALKLMVPRIGEKKARAIVDASWRLEQIAVRDLIALFSA
jgi:2-methylcitrate dehydratase PrpD